MIKLLTLLSPTARQTMQLLQPLAIVTAGGLFLCLIMYFGYLQPAADQRRHVIESFAHLRQVQIEHQVARKTQEDLTAFWKQLPDQKDFTELGVTITLLAKKNRVSVPGMLYNVNPAKQNQSAKGSISFEASGNYKAIRQFIYELETTGPSLFIEKFAAERAKKGNQVAFKIQVGTYFKPDSALTTSRDTTS